MKRIYKYQLSITRVQEVVMPTGAKLLTAQMQGGMICVWAMVREGAELVKRRFSIVGTGHQSDLSEKNYVGTVQDDGFVWHVFDDGEAY